MKLYLETNLGDVFEIEGWFNTDGARKRHLITLYDNDYQHYVEWFNRWNCKPYEDRLGFIIMDQTIRFFSEIKQVWVEDE